MLVKCKEMLFMSDDLTLLYILKDWTHVLEAASCKEKFQLFSSEINRAIELLLPWRTVKINSSDRPWITKRLKSSIKKRQEAFIKHGKDSSTHKMWRNNVQKEIKSAKRLYYRNKVADLELDHSSSENWWNHIKRLTGKDTKQDWQYQFLDRNCPDLLSLRNKVNNFNQFDRSFYTSRASSLGPSGSSP